MESKCIIDKDDKIWRNKNGLCHREDGPAIECANGTKFWYKNGLKHREDGPAIERVNETKEWYKEGERHRLDGPAIEAVDGYKEYWLEGFEIPDWFFEEHLELKAEIKSLRSKIET